MSDKKPVISMSSLMSAASKAMMTGDWASVLDVVKPVLAPSIGSSLQEYDKEGAKNSSYIITKKTDAEGNVNVFLSVIERPETMVYVNDKDGCPVVRDIGDLMDIIMKK